MIFRQAETSQIIRNAHRINRGESPDTSNENEDFFVFVEEDPEKSAELLIDVVENRVPRRFGLDAVEDIQVLAPMYRGPVGVAVAQSGACRTGSTRTNPGAKRSAGWPGGCSAWATK